MNYRNNSDVLVVFCRLYVTTVNFLLKTREALNHQTTQLVYYSQLHKRQKQDMPQGLRTHTHTDTHTQPTHQLSGPQLTLRAPRSDPGLVLFSCLIPLYTRGRTSFRRGKWISLCSYNLCSVQWHTEHAAIHPSTNVKKSLHPITPKFPDVSMTLVLVTQIPN